MFVVVDVAMMLHMFVRRREKRKQNQSERNLSKVSSFPFGYTSLDRPAETLVVYPHFTF